MGTFSKNLLTLFGYSGCRNHTEFAAFLSIGRSTLSRMMNGHRDPNPADEIAIARAFGLERKDLFLSSSDLEELLSRKRTSSNLSLLSLRTIKNSVAVNSRTAKKYGGDYKIFAPFHDQDYLVLSHLRIGKSRNEGVEVFIANPYLRSDGSYDVFEYAGYIYEIDNYLYLFSEQVNSLYEILTAILYSSPLPEPEYLEGLWCGVGVQDEKRYIASTPIVAMRQKRQQDDWRGVIGSEFGIIPEGKVPHVVKKKLQHDQIVIERQR